MGVKGSAFINSFLTLANLMVMGIVIVVGFYYGKIDNWINTEKGFLPYGISGAFVFERERERDGGCFKIRYRIRAPFLLIGSIGAPSFNHVILIEVGEESLSKLTQM